MLPFKILANNVLNLTDARYFAARGADYICLNELDSNNNLSPEEVLAIADWIDGPMTLLHFISDDYFIEFSEKFNPDGWIFNKQDAGLPPSQVFDHLTFLNHTISDFKSVNQNQLVGTEIVLGFDYLILDIKQTGLTLEEVESSGALPILQTVCAASAVFLDAIIKSDEDIKILEKINPEGIVLHGGKEDEVGVKVYDELDNVFDLLEDNFV